jgi:GAF domain-containing protein
MVDTNLIAEIAMTFISTDTVEEAANKIVKIVGSSIDVSRCYIFVNHDENIKFSKRFEWCALGAVSCFDEFTDLSYKDYPTLTEALFRKKFFMAENTDEYPEDLNALFDPGGVKSLILAGVFINGELKGLFGVSECNRLRRWHTSEIETIITIAKLISKMLPSLFHI